MCLRCYCRLSVLCLFVGLARPATAQSDSAGINRPEKRSAQQPTAIKPLFTTTDVLSMTLSTYLTPLLRNRTPAKTGTPERAFPALLTTATNTGQTGQFPIQLQVRGNFRRQSANCLFPPLYLTLPRPLLRDTPFARQKKLKLVTHCTDEQYVVKEYQVYQLFNLLTDLSFRARLARVTYADSAKKNTANALTRWGILLEDDHDLADRNQATLYKNPYRAEHCDTLTMATVALFEFMIGNTDWSVPYRHNIRLMTDADHARPRPVPYDFDHSGLVNAPYAKPAEQLELGSVRERLYRGPIYPLPVLTRTIARFNAAKPAVYALYETDTHLDRAYIRQTITYLDAFYRLINTPKEVVQVFQEPAGRGVQIKGLR